jgi:hypothetical protein
MPSSTSTFTSSKAKSDTNAARLRSVAQETSTSSKADVGNEQDNFFWTYTEEPHRTRRQAIIKAHPEVLNLLLVPEAAANDDQPGYQALRARVIDKILCYRGRLAANIMRLPTSKYTVLVMAILFDGVSNWSYSQPEPLPGYP